MNLLKSEKTSLNLIFTGFILIILGIVAFLWLDSDFSLDAQIDSEKFARFGDFIGGLVGSLWALAGVILFYIALTEQRRDSEINREALSVQVDTLNQQVEEFKLQRKELVSSRKVYEQQSKTFKIQQFESSFFSLLSVYQAIKDKLDSLVDNKDYFRKIFGDISKSYTIKTDILNHHDQMIHSYTEMFNENRGYLSHYFKTFYRIIKILDSNTSLDDKEKFYYAQTIRSQLTDYEQLILFYNSHSIYGNKTKPIFLKYNLLKHLPIFSKPEFEFYLKAQGNNDILSFTDNFRQFLIRNLNAYFDLSAEAGDIVERLDFFNCLIGIHYSETIRLEVTCEKNISVNKFLMDDEHFLAFLLLITTDTIVIATYTSPEQVIINKYITETDDKKIFGIEISLQAETNLNLTYDRY